MPIGLLVFKKVLNLILKNQDTATKKNNQNNEISEIRFRVAMVREKVLENEKKIQVREKSGNYIFSQGNFKKMKKVMEKSGNFKIFLKRC